MTLDQLRIFVAVAEREHIRRAAEHVHLAQSAVSHAVAQLGAEFGIVFFNRVGRRIELTANGRLFLEEARSVFARAATTRERLHDVAACAGESCMSTRATPSLATGCLRG